MIIRPQYMELLKTCRDVPLVKILAESVAAENPPFGNVAGRSALKALLSRSRISMRILEDLDEGMTDKDMA